MVRHMMRQDMRRSDMIQDYAAVSYYAGNRSYLGASFGTLILAEKIDTG